MTSLWVRLPVTDLAALAVGRPVEGFVGVVFLILRVFLAGAGDDSTGGRFYWSTVGRCYYRTGSLAGDGFSEDDMPTVAVSGMVEVF